MDQLVPMCIHTTILATLVSSAKPIRVRAEGQRVKKSQVIVVEAANDKPGTTSQEQHSTSQAGPSFAWLVSTPVVRHATDRQRRSIRIKPMEGKETKSIMKYRNGKYVKSW